MKPSVINDSFCKYTNICKDVCHGYGVTAYTMATLTIANIIVFIHTAGVMSNDE